MVSASAPNVIASSSPVTVQSSTGPTLLQAAVEELMDGILIITAQGNIVELNQQARQICSALNVETSASSDAQTQLPDQIWHPCQELIAANQFLPGQPVVPEFEISVADTQTLRVRLRWLETPLPELNGPFLLVMLEQHGPSLSSRRHDRLSEREYQVWHLRAQGYSYQSIANQLYITTHTVKKHLKNVRMKQRSTGREMQISA